jgi:uncharacterized protein YutE (UPF0331/DUF86 family)
MSPEQAIVETLLGEMEKNVDLLEELKTVSQEDFVRDPKAHLLAERCFQLAIQCLVDAAYRLAADEAWPKPQDSVSALSLLGERGVVPKAFVEKTHGMLKFRNILVHAYLHIDRGIVHAKLAEIEDFREFERHVLKYLADRRQGGT